MTNISVVGSKDGPVVDERELDTHLDSKGLAPLPAYLAQTALNTAYTGETPLPTRLSASQLTATILTQSGEVVSGDQGALLADEMRWFRNQLGGVDTEPVDILCVGDSTMEGARALTRAGRWVDTVLRRLRAKYQPVGIAGGLGYTPAVYTGGIPFGAASWSYLNALGPGTIYSDSFARSGELNTSLPQIGAAWIATPSGNYTLNGTDAVTQTAGGTVAFANVGTSADREVVVNGQFGAMTSTSQYFQLLAMYDGTSPNNKVWLEAVVSTTVSTWRIVKKISGTQTTMATYSTPPVAIDPSNATFLAKFKVDGLVLTATVNGNVLTANLTQPEKDSLANAMYTAFNLPVVGSKLNDYNVNTLGPAEITVTPTLEAGWGLGLRAVKLGPTGSCGVMRRTFTGTAVDVITTKRSGGATIAVKIDGVTKTSIDTANATEVNGFATRYGSLTQGSHVLELSCASGYAVVEGIMEYNQDETSGIRVWDAAHAGYNSASYVNVTKWATTAVAVMTPDLAFLALGINDFGSAGTITPAQFKTNMLAIIASIRVANPACPVVLHNSYERGDLTSPPYAWTAYLTAMEEIAAADPAVILVDLNARLKGWNNVTAEYRDVWDADKIHINPKGMGVTANAVLSVIDRA